jgi:hypothetical protein
MTTALHELIDHWKTERTKCPEGLLELFDLFIQDAENNLELEEKQIKLAWKNGYLNGFKDIPEFFEAEEFYNNTFKHN